MSNITDPITAILNRIEAKADPTSTPGVQNPTPKFATAYTPLEFPLNFQLTDAVTRNAYQAVQLWINDITHNFTERARTIILHGRPGAGKSHLLHETVRTLREHRRKVVSKNAINCADILREGNTHTLEQFWAPAAIFCLDDFGAEYHTEWLTTQWFSLFDQRINKWTFITTNLSPAQIESRYDSRIASRLFSTRNTIVDLSQAQDFRKKLSYL